MKGKVWLFLWVVCLPVWLVGQSEFDASDLFEDSSQTHQKAFTLFLSAAHLSANEPYPSTYAGGMKIRMFLGEHFSFDSEILFGKDHNQFGVGTLGIPLWLLGTSIIDTEDGSWEGALFLGALMLLSAEHMAYHIPANSRMDISPYVSFLRIKEFSGLDESESPDGLQSPICFALGLEINNYFKRFVVAPYVDYNVAYSGGFRGFNIGINIGYHFPYKR